MTTEQPTTPNTQRAGQPSTGSPRQQVLAWVLLAVPVLIFGIVWAYYAVNIPKWDDHALRAFLFNFDQESTWTGKIYQLFKQHNEHRIVYDRIVSALDYHLFGQLNYVHLMLIGNLSLVGLLGIFMAAMRQSRLGLSGQWVLYSLPIAWLLFNLSQWENMFWGMAALQNFSVVLWILAAFYFLSYTRHWVLALLAGALATLTSGNGLLVWPIGFLILLLRLPAYATSSHRKSYVPLIGWSIGAILISALYFNGFEKPGDAKYVKPGVIDLVKGWLAVLGAAAEAIPSSFPLRNSIGLGGLLAVITLGIVVWSLLANRTALGYALRSAIAPKTAIRQSEQSVPSLTLFFWACATFILGTAAVVAWARTGAGIDLLITSRYKMYSLTGLALLYLFGVVNLQKRVARWWMLAGLLGSGLLAILSYFSFLDETIWWRHWSTTNQFNWTHTANTPAFSSDSVSMQYTPPTPAFYDNALPTLYGHPEPTVVPLQLTKTDGGFAVQNSTIPAQGLGDAGLYLVARSANRMYLFPVWQKQQSILSARFIPKKLFKNGFVSSLQSASMDAGKYQLFVLTVSEKDAYALYPTNQTIVSSGPPDTIVDKNW